MNNININLDNIPIYDHHAHPLSNLSKISSPEKFHCWFTESNETEVIKNNAQETLFFKTALKLFSKFYHCKPDISDILQERSKFSNKKLICKIFSELNIKNILIDYDLTGLPKPYSLEEISSMTKAKVDGILRIETFIEKLFQKYSNLDSVINVFENTLTDKIEKRKIKGLKSIAAYRTGLKIESVKIEIAKTEFIKFKKRNSTRLENKVIIDFFVDKALQISNRHSFPVQFHTGFGDNDVNLILANPLHLTPLIKKYKNIKFILLHSGWPYHKETAFLTSLYNNTWIDLSLMIPFVTTAIEPALKEIFGITPFNKILFATDAFAIPEIYWLAVKLGKKYISNELSRLYNQRFLNYKEVEQITEMIFYKNSEMIYEN